jgi:hypothetical protein
MGYVLSLFPLQRRNRVVHALLGFILLAAAGLKIYGFNVTAVPPSGPFSGPQVQMLSVEWELLLGLWLFAGWLRLAVWFAAVGTFLTFTGISGYLGWIGQATCGCLGTIEASPWHALSVDLAALTLLATSPPGPAFWRRNSALEQVRARPRLAAPLLGTATILGASALAAVTVYGTPARILARLRGETLTAAPAYLDFGEGDPGQVLKAKIALRNWTDEPVRVVGGTRDCTANVTENLPVAIPAGGAATVEIQFKVPPSASGALTRDLLFWTDCAQQQLLLIRAGCRIRAIPAETAPSRSGK